MQHLEKINYLRIAYGIAGFRIKDEDIDLIISLYEKVLDKQGETTLDDVVEVTTEVHNRVYGEKDEGSSE